MSEIMWIAKLLKEVYDNREHGMGLWDKALAKVLGPSYRIAFVGPGGIGKTVLLDHMTGKALKKGYKPPEAQSRNAETGGVKAKGRRLAFTVAPGQDAGPKFDTYERIFDPAKPVNGVVFVAGFGFETIRSDYSVAVERESLGRNTLETFRAAKLAEELSVLDEVLLRMRPALRASNPRCPAWMLVASTKADLYQNEIAEAEAYYAPHKDSDFTARIREFACQVGTDNFEWDTVPVASWLEDFEWAGERVQSTLTKAERDAYIGQMITRIGDLCR